LADLVLTAEWLPRSATAATPAFTSSNENDADQKLSPGRKLKIVFGAADGFDV
jgi:hypothetical protein